MKRLIFAAALAIPACASPTSPTSPTGPTAPAAATLAPVTEGPAPSPTPTPVVEPTNSFLASNIDVRFDGDMAIIGSRNTGSGVVYVTTWVIHDFHGDFLGSQTVLGERVVPMRAGAQSATVEARIPGCGIAYQIDVATVAGATVAARGKGAKYRPDELVGSTIVKEDQNACFTRESCAAANPPRFRFLGFSGAINAAAKAENDGDWTLTLYAASSLRKYNNNDPDYAKGVDDKSLECGQSTTLRIIFDWSGHPSPHWWVVLTRNGAVMFKSPAQTRPVALR